MIIHIGDIYVSEIDEFNMSVFDYFYIAINSRKEPNKNIVENVSLRHKSKYLPLQSGIYFIFNRIDRYKFRFCQGDVMAITKINNFFRTPYGIYFKS